MEIFGVLGPIGGAWQVFEHLENPEKNAKNDYFEKEGQNMILGTHHNNIKDDDFHILQNLFHAYFDPSNFL